MKQRIHPARLQPGDAILRPSNPSNPSNPNCTPALARATKRHDNTPAT